MYKYIVKRPDSEIKCMSCGKTFRPLSIYETSVICIKCRKKLINNEIENEKESYLPHIRTTCYKCGRSIGGNWKHYKMYGNFCKQCDISYEPRNRFNW